MITERCFITDPSCPYSLMLIGVTLYKWTLSGQNTKLGQLVMIKPEFNSGSAYTPFHFSRTLPLSFGLCTVHKPKKNINKYK